MPISHSDHPSDSIEAYLTLRSGPNRSVYAALLVIVICGLGALPLVRVPISVRAPGLIRPATERHELRAPLSGFVEELNAADNQFVTARYQLLLLRADAARASRERLAARLRDLDADIAGLQLLTADDTASLGRSLSSPRRDHEREALRTRLAATREELVYARDELDRTSSLAARGLAPTVDLRDREIRLARLLSDSLELITSSRAAWAADLESSRVEREHVLTEMEAGSSEIEQARLSAPVSGYLDEITPISPGSYVSAGTLLFALSPAGEAVAEVYVPAREIAPVRVGSGVRILVDSFDHTVWGVLAGRVRAISPDHLVMDDLPVFVVEVALDSETLTTRSGASGSVQPGMTLQAHFEVASRSLWQLLRDDIDDWLNPLRG